MPATSRWSSAKRLVGAEVSDSVVWVSLLVSMRVDTLPRESDIGKNAWICGELLGLQRHAPQRALDLGYPRSLQSRYANYSRRDRSPPGVRGVRVVQAAGRPEAGRPDQ